MSTTTIRLLQTAVDIVGGLDVLAERLGIRTASLALYLEDVRRLPDSLLLKAVDIILEDRQSRFPRPEPQLTAQPDDR